VPIPDHEDLLITGAPIVSGGAPEVGWIRFAGSRVLARGIGGAPEHDGTVLGARRGSCRGPA
jgi:hypothetical protein